MIWTFLVPFGVLGAFAVWIAQRVRLSKLSRIVIIAVIIALEVGLTMWPGAPNILGDEEKSWYLRSPGRETIFFLLMLLGMAARYVTGAIEDRRRKIEKLATIKVRFEKPRLQFDGWEFSYPLFVSVVTFGGLLSQIQDQSLSVTNMILCFQTGFFWQTVLAVRTPVVPHDK